MAGVQDQAFTNEGSMKVAYGQPWGYAGTHGWTHHEFPESKEWPVLPVCTYM